MKLSQIKIAGMHKVKEHTYNLENFNYLFGKNGAGKSTVMQAIQLALLGYIPGTDKNKTAIFRHANGPLMEITLHFDDDRYITRRFEKTAKDVKSSITSNPDGLNIAAIISDLELPILNFSEFVGMTSNKLKDWFINFLPTNGNTVDWNTELTNAITNLTTDFTIASTVADDITAEYGTGIDSVRSFNEQCKAKISNLKTDIARMQSTVQELIHYDDCDMSLNEADIEKQIHDLELIRDSLVGKSHKLTQNQSIATILESVSAVVGEYSDIKDNPEYTALKDKLLSLQNKYADCISKRRELDLSITNLDIENTKMRDVVDRGGICPYSSTICDSIKATIAEYEPKIVDNDKRIAEYNAARQELDNIKNDTNSEISDTNLQIQSIESAYAKYNANVPLYDSELAKLSQADIDKERTEVESKLSQLRQQLVEVRANKKYDSLMATLAQDKIKAELDLEIYKAWEKLTSVNGLQSKLMNAPFISFALKITKYLKAFYAGSDVSAQFHIGEKANSFSFGLIRDGKYIEFDLLSSGEKCLYTLALSLAIVDSSDSELKLLLVDDLLDHLDPENIENCFSTLYNDTSVQMIIAGVQPCGLADGIIKIGEN
jgi:exonuclease SbcC